MNIRRSIDYSQMYQAIDDVMSGKLPQMQLYCAIGSIVCIRSEKGAAVMASEYIRAKYPEVHGFSPRNLRRMRDFWRTYENHSALLSLAMEIGWTQNVVIMEAELTMKLREWYLRAARQFGWSKAELLAQIAAEAHLVIILDIVQEEENIVRSHEDSCMENAIRFPGLFVQTVIIQRCRGRPEKRAGQWCLPTDWKKQRPYMRC